MQVRFQLERRATSLRITSLEITAGAAGVSGVVARGALADFDPAPDFELTDQRGARFSLAEQRGLVLLLDFVFTRCPGPCPILTARQVAVQRRIPEALRDRAHFISVSIDPAYDTPERLRAFGESHRADLAHWSFLTGSADEVQAVMDAYHVGAVRQPGERLEHRIVTFLIGPGGRIRQRYLGLEHRPEEILSDLADLLGASGRDSS
jgi:protein SCO1/2